jgi:hypothetical protein
MRVHRAARLSYQRGVYARLSAAAQAHEHSNSQGAANFTRAMTRGLFAGVRAQQLIDRVVG